MAVTGLAPVKRNRFIQLDGAVKSVNRELEDKARTLAGIRGYKTNLAATPDGEPVTPDFVISSWSIRKFVRTARRYRTIEIQAGRQTITAADPLPDDLRQALSAINASEDTHEFGLSQGWRRPARCFVAVYFTLPAITSRACV